jgi:hypothetical protein
VETLKIDEKWSVVYDPDRNDRPVKVLRYGEAVSGTSDWKNDVLAMFYALLECRRGVNQEIARRLRLLNTDMEKG